MVINLLKTVFLYIKIHLKRVLFLKKLKHKYQIKINLTVLAVALAVVIFLVINITPFSFASPSDDELTNSSLSNFQESEILTATVDSMELESKKHLGLLYIWGGITPAGFDSSGLMQFIFAKHGIKLPRTAAQQFEIGEHVKTEDLRKGDLVFFTTYREGASHVGMYLGEGKFINTNNNGLMIDSLDDDYWMENFLGAKRMFIETTTGLFYGEGVSKTEVAPSQQTSFELNEDGRTYTIQGGNTLTEIASHFNTTVEELMELNQLKDSSSLMIGQNLIVKTWLPLVDYFEYVKDIPMPFKHQEFVFLKSQRLDLDYAELLAIIAAESDFNTDLISDENDYGYYQINQIHHDSLSTYLDTRNAPLDPIINIAWGTHMLDDYYMYWEEKGLEGQKLNHYVWASFHQNSYGINDKTILQSAAYIETLEKTIPKIERVLHSAIKYLIAPF